MPAFNYVQLDTRPNAVNPEFDFGIEVTMAIDPKVPNLDHHRKGDTAETPAACEQAMTCALPDAGARIAFVRADADSIVAAAVLEARAAEKPVNKGLINAIALMDRIGPKIEGNMPYREHVVAIARYSANPQVSLEERVSFALNLLETTAIIQSLVEARDVEFAAAEKASEITEIVPGKLVFVRSTHRFATNIGYRVASTVVAFNPEMPVLEGGKPTGVTYKKFTVCRYDSNVPTDLPAALVELQALEKDWGGRGDIFGSPQNVSSELTHEKVLEVVKKYVK